MVECPKCRRRSVELDQRCQSLRCIMDDCNWWEDVRNITQLRTDAERWRKLRAVVEFGTATLYVGPQRFCLTDGSNLEAVVDALPLPADERK